MNGNFANRFRQRGSQAVLVALCLLIGLLSCLSSEAFWGYFAALFGFFSLAENPVTVYLFDHPDLGHVVAYGLLTLLLFFTLRRRPFLQPPTIAFFFGLLMEAAQFLVPSRGSSWSDLSWNLLGIVAATFIWWLSGGRGARQQIE